MWKEWKRAITRPAKTSLRLHSTEPEAVIFLGVIAGAVGSVAGLAVILQYFHTIYLVLLGDLKTRNTPSGSEPAYRQYFFRKAYMDYWRIASLSLARSGTTAEAVIKWTPNLSGCGLYGCILMVTVMAGGLAGVVVGAVSFLAISLVHLLVVSAFCLVAVILAYLFRSVEYVSMAWRRVFVACPHAGCYKRIALAVYLCPGCGAEHQKLMPGSYGTFRRRCRCGASLPTLFLFGRSRLPSLCPHPACRRLLPQGSGIIPNLHLPVVGAATAGKTSLLAATMVELCDRQSRGELQLEFPEAKDERTFHLCRDAFAAGALVAKTAEYSPNAFTVKLTDGRGSKRLVYMYDAAGELYQGSDQLHGHDYYSYLHGILLVIDPFSFPEALVSEEGELSAAAQLAIKPAQEGAEQVYGRMAEALRNFRGKRGSLGQPLAVVLTKIDALKEDLTPKPGPQSSQLADEQSQRVRDWLARHGQGNLIRTIEQDFARVRYFACSALGRLPDSAPGPFVPVGALLPLAWLLRENGVRLEPTRLALPAAVAPALRSQGA